MAKITELSQQIVKWERTLKALQGSSKASRQRVADMEKERRGYLVAARAQEDTAAKKRLAEIDAALEVARKNGQDDADAAKEAATEIERMKGALALAGKQGERERLRSMLQDRATATIEARIVELTNQLRSALDERITSERQLAVELRSFSPRLESTANHLAGTATAFPIEVNVRRDALDDLVAHAQAKFRGILGALDHLPLEGEIRSGDLRLFEARGNVAMNGLHLSTGDRLWRDPRGVADLVAAGLLQECDLSSQPGTDQPAEAAG